MPVLGATMEDAALFLTYNQVQHALRNVRGVSESTALPLLDLGVAAAASGAMAAIVLTPVELIKCRMQVQQMGRTLRAPAPNAAALIWETVQKSGVSGLWHGLSGTLIREVGGGIAWFLSFELATREFVRRRALARPADAPPPTKADLGSVELAVSGALAGVSYNVSLFPADSVKSAMQTQRELRAHTREAAAPPLGFMSMLMRLYQTRGLAGLYAGVGVTCLRSAPSSGTCTLLTAALVLYVCLLTQSRISQAGAADRTVWVVAIAYIGTCTHVSHGCELALGARRLVQVGGRGGWRFANVHSLGLAPPTSCPFFLVHCLPCYFLHQHHVGYDSLEDQGDQPCCRA